jgi:ABC-2 type transport system ATP-binding protein
VAIEIATRPRGPDVTTTRDALVATSVSKTFKSEKSPRRAVDGVSLRVQRGEIYGLLGANGSGKSTLIRMFSTLLIPDEGAVRVFDHDVQKDELAVKRLINRVSVEASFFKKLSAMENLVYAGRLYGVAPDDARQKAHEILRRLGIAEDRLHEPLEKLSRGMQQKIAIARAFLTAPMLLLLDEPTTGLDIRSKREVQTFVQDLRLEHDATIVLTTHDLDEAERLSDRVGIIHDGRLVAEGTVDELRARYGASALEEVFMTATGRRLDDADEADRAK